MYVLGLDIGGTSSRALLIDSGGRRAGYGTAGGGNPAAHGNAVAVANIGLALRQALRGVDPSLVAGAVIGMAGAGALDRLVFDPMWASAGLRARPRLTGDLGIAFAAGTAEPRGTVLIAGTGAIAARIEDREPVMIADGLGWLLGDRGSGFWLGRQAARAAARALSRGDAGGTLTRLVIGALLEGEPLPQGKAGGTAEEATEETRAPAIRLVVRAQSRPTLELARLAPLVSRAADEGDPAALEIASTAARLLCETVAEVRPAGETSPIVLAGSVLTGEGPVGSAVREKLGATAVLAGDGAGAAAWLAGREAFGWDPAAAALLHARIVSGD
ncbi:ATPase [Streptosporangium sp. NBC_01755]|uniref:N-acetylglucosamine kinase n=1 Tax=Streptosporangium sp. NBC_01755 TaxID=2975949 RepID=UPI002DDA293C|nr:BadF/BadG/BcrA/BcrD ATPase family protein [Streptosporangium sp. NBC_01755]WSC98166.1 ATPase [Streptosporangium sp. NBC_01755]